MCSMCVCVSVCVHTACVYLKNTIYDQPAVGFVLPVHIETQPLQGLWGGAEIQGPLKGAVAAVDHLVDLLETIGQL